MPDFHNAVLLFYCWAKTNNQSRESRAVQVGQITIRDDTFCFISYYPRRGRKRRRLITLFDPSLLPAWSSVIKTEKTIYDKAEPSDGKRILVMRIWPRGISKDKIDMWMKELGTDRDLIKKWKNGKISWKDFSIAYRKSLRGKEELLKQLAKESKEGDITLLCTDRDAAHCHRTLLAQEIRKYMKEWTG